jgi:hypothetical protein
MLSYKERIDIMTSLEDNENGKHTATDDKEQAMEAGYAALAADPEFQQEQARRKVMRGVIRRRSAIKLRWPDN